MTLRFTRETQSLLAVFACVLVASIGLGLIGPLVNLLLNERGISRTIIGLNAAMVAAAILIMTPVIPSILRRMGKGAFLSACLILCTFCFLLYPLLEPPWAWFPLRFVMGAGICGLFVVSEAWINQLASEGRRGLLIGAYATTHALGFAAGALIVTLVGADGPLPFIIGSAAMALAGIPIFFARSLAPPSEHNTAMRPWHFIAIVPAIMLSALIFAMIEMGGLGLIPVFGARLGLSVEGAAFLLVVTTLGNILCQVPLGYLADRMDRRLLLASCALIALALSIALPFVFEVKLLLYSVLFLLGGVVLGLYTIGLTLLGERFKGRELTAANAAFIFMYGGGSLIGPALAGVAMDLSDPHGLIHFFVLTIALYLITIAFARDRSRRAAT